MFINIHYRCANVTIIYGEDNFYVVVGESMMIQCNDMVKFVDKYDLYLMIEDDILIFLKFTNFELRFLKA